MRYNEISPAAHLRPYFESFWVFDTPVAGVVRRPHVIVPDGAVSIGRVTLPDGTSFLTLVGPSERAHRSPVVPGARIAGLRLRPGAAGSVLKTDVTALRDVFGRLDEHLPAIGAMFADVLAQPGSDDPRALEAVAERLVADAEPLDADVCAFAAAVVAAGGDCQLNAVGRELDVGPRQLRRRFQYQCGLSPKEFARLRRMRQTCMNILTSRSGRLAIAAVESGFTDQAHMAREFSKVFGDTTTLVMEHLASIEHGDFIKDLP